MLETKKNNAWLRLGALLLSLIILAGLGFWLTHREIGPIQKNVRKQVSFSILEPQPKTAWELDPKSIIYSTKTNVLTMTAESQNITISINEQAQPDTFNDVPQYYSSLLNKLNQYVDLHTDIGTITLTHPKELNGGQTAVVNLKQTLIFARPSKNLTNSQWKDFFNSMQWD